MYKDAMSPLARCIKRLIDIIASFFGMVILSPFYLAIWLAIKIEDGGKPIFSQERIGRNGTPFQIYKFRTMRVNNESDNQQATKNDPRKTKLGEFLRKTSIDELPQFWNVLKGDMSIVGPRPERRYYIEQIEKIAPYYCLVYKVKPGLLSWGPIKIGYSDTVEKMVERLRYDIIYMDNMTLQTDIKILFYSIEVIFLGKGQ